MRVRESVREIIQRYLNAQAGHEKLMREYEEQVEFGVCPAVIYVANTCMYYTVIYMSHILYNMGHT